MWITTGLHTFEHSVQLFFFVLAISSLAFSHAQIMGAILKKKEGKKNEIVLVKGKGKFHQHISPMSK